LLGFGRHRFCYVWPFTTRNGSCENDVKVYIGKAARVFWKIKSEGTTLQVENMDKVVRIIIIFRHVCAVQNYGLPQQHRPKDWTLFVTDGKQSILEMSPGRTVANE